MVNRKSTQNRVWIVDDNKYFCAQLAKLLSESSIIKEASTYYSCESALEAMSDISFKPPDVILLDVYFSNSTMTGLYALNLFKRKAPASKIIIITAFEEEISARIAFNSGASGFLIKNTSDEKNVIAVELSLQNVSIVESTIASKVVPQACLNTKLNSNHGLTLREKEIVCDLIEGFSMKEIASKNYISFATVNSHLKNIYRKYSVHSRSELIAKVLDIK